MNNFSISENNTIDAMYLQASAYHFETISLVNNSKFDLFRDEQNLSKLEKNFKV